MGTKRRLIQGVLMSKQRLVHFPELALNARRLCRYFTDFDGPAPRVVYRGTDGHIHELWYRSG